MWNRWHEPMLAQFTEAVGGDELTHWGRVMHIWVRSRNWGCLVTWFCYQLIAKPGNKTAAVSWPDPYASVNLPSLVQIMVQWFGSWSVPSHYLNHCWNIVILILRNKLKYQMKFMHFHSRKFIWKCPLWNGILSWPQCVKKMSLYRNDPKFSIFCSV